MLYEVITENERPGRRIDINEGLGVAWGVRFLRRCGHHQSQARILELEGARTLWDDDIVGAADHAVRVDVRGVDAAGLQEVDPHAVERKLRVAEIVVERAGSYNFV